MAHSRRVQSTMVEKTWLQEGEATGHMASSQEVERYMLVLSSLSPFLFSLGPQPTESRCPHLGWVFIPQLT